MEIDMKHIITPDDINDFDFMMLNTEAFEILCGNSVEGLELVNANIGSFTQDAIFEAGKFYDKPVYCNTAIWNTQLIQFLKRMDPEYSKKAFLPFNMMDDKNGN